jgi:NADH-quinone oxidoreductase subunit M
MVYDRTHTRRLADLRAMPLHRLMPFAALTFVLGGMASMGMPGFSGFPAELTILIGAWKTSPRWTLFAAIGVLVTAAFTLRAIHVSFFGTTDRSVPHVAAHAEHPFSRISVPERLGALLLIGATAFVGLKPDVLLNWITPALQSPLMQAALQGGPR